ncbi:hypothetical protein ACGFNU_26130 [Spirillospora sp. NPDC048911]|uniref:hypothetical protein n=1 Tax=Spirillospora sp. NPDC048911 TaxID=3364527 RepID=UPI003717185C
MPGLRTRAGVLGALAAALTTLSVTPAMATTPTAAVIAPKPATAADAVNPNVILSIAERPDVGAPWTDRQAKSKADTLPCGVYERPTGADAGLTYFHQATNYWGWDTALVFPTAAKADAAYRQYQADLLTCEDRNPETEYPAMYIKDLRQVDTEDGVPVYKALSNPSGYPGAGYQFAVVRQGRVLYSLVTWDQRWTEHPTVEFGPAIRNIKNRIATYYP